MRTNTFSLESLKKLTFSFMKILQEIVNIFLYMVNFIQITVLTWYIMKFQLKKNNSKTMLNNQRDHPCCCCSVAIVCYSVWPCGLSHTRFPCPSLSSSVNSNSWVYDAIQLSHPLLSCSFAFNLPRIRVFSNDSALCIRWTKYQSLSFIISLSQYSFWSPEMHIPPTSHPIRSFSKFPTISISAQYAWFHHINQIQVQMRL